MNPSPTEQSQIARFGMFEEEILGDLDFEPGCVICGKTATIKVWRKCCGHRDGYCRKHGRELVRQVDEWMTLGGRAQCLFCKATFTGAADVWLEVSP